MSQAFAGAPGLPLLDEEPSLKPAERSALVASVLAAHLAVAWGLLQLEAVREAAAEVAPLFVSLVTSRPEPEPPSPATLQPQSRTQPKPMPRPPTPVRAAAPQTHPATAGFIEPAAPIASQAESSPAPQVATEAAAAPPSAPAAHAAATVPAPPGPRVVPLAEVRYLVPPAPAYPAVSRRLGETGEVLLRVQIGIDGHARQVSVQHSSGFPRLDESALAAVRAVRFAPYLDRGVAAVVWTTVPIVFELAN